MIFNENRLRTLKKAFLTLLILPFLLFFLCLDNAYASSLSWAKTFNYGGHSGSIKVAESNTNIVYGSISQDDNDYDILKSIDGGLNWISVKGNLPIGNDINWISIYKQNPAIVAVSLWQSGVFLTEDSGQTWTDIYSSATPRSVEIDPNNFNIIFVGIGGNHDSFSGVYKTINKGANWTKLLPLNNNNGEIVINRTNSNEILADSDPDFYRSLDGGSNWTKLPLIRAYSNSIVDTFQQNTIYSSQSDINIGVYKSIDNGDSWSIKNNGFTQVYYHLAQNTDGSLFASQVGYGGVWRSTDGAEHWENVGDPSWGNANTWGLDARGGRVYVSVEGKGIFVANSDGTPIVQQINPVVLIPGLGASWSKKGLIDYQPTTYQDWELLPKASDYFYKSTFDTLATAGLVMNQTMFPFAYDWTQQISLSAASLNQFLQNEVLSKNPGMKADIVGHSMGGLVAAYCFEKVPTCSDKINKIFSVGAPYQGAVDDYPIWEGGKFDDSPLPVKALAGVLLDRRDDPSFSSTVSLIHSRAKGFGDIMPIFDYVNGKKYQFMSPIGHNLALESLSSPSSAFKQLLTVAWGDKKPTSRNLNVETATQWEQLNGLWPDGRPVSKAIALGDDTVLDFSAKLTGASDNLEYTGGHMEYLRDNAVLAKMLSTFNLVGTPTISSDNLITSLLIFFLHSPADLVIKDSQGNIVGTTDASGKAVFLVNPFKDIYHAEVTATGSGEFAIAAVYADQNTGPIRQEIVSTINTGQKKDYYFNFQGATSSAFINSQSDFLQSLKIDLAKSGNKNAIQIGNNVEKTLNTIKSPKVGQLAIAGISAQYLQLINLVRVENSTIPRSYLLLSADDLFNLLVQLDLKYGAGVSAAQAKVQIAVAQVAINQFAAKKKMSSLDALNLQLANEDLSLSKTYLSSGANFKSSLLSLAALTLAH